MSETNKTEKHERDIALQDDDFRHDDKEFDSVAGEEDPGAGLEALVENDKLPGSQRKSE